MPEIVIGILVALLVFEFSGYSTGGIISAGYIALYMSHPLFIAGTLVAGVITYVAVKLLGKFIVLYGKRLFTVYLITGLIISQILTLIFTKTPSGTEFYSIGYLLPGLIARDADSQGWGVTLGALTLSVGLINMLVFACRGWLWI